jgi:hypothetical protein
MNLDKLKIQLSKVADIVVLKQGLVFTVLLKGKNLAKWETVNKINLDILECAGKLYPNIETMANDDDYFMIVLRS